MDVYDKDLALHMKWYSFIYRKTAKVKMLHIDPRVTYKNKTKRYSKQYWGHNGIPQSIQVIQNSMQRG
jgi:hypothetical protein